MAQIGPFELSRGGAATIMAICALTLSACGGDDESGTIPEEQAQALLAQLNEIDDAIEAGDCETAEAQALTFAQAVNELPAEVDPEVRERIVEGARNLESQTGTQCEPADTGATGEEAVIPPPETEEPIEEPPAVPPPVEEEEEPTGDEKPGNPNPGQGNSGGGSGNGSSGGVGSD